MKRERAVWNDEEDELITIAKNSSTKAYGRKPLSQDYADNLRMEYQTVYGTQKWATKEAADEFNSDSDFETFLASTSASNAITKFRDESVKPKRRQDLNIDGRAEKCGSIGSVSWQPLSSMDSDPLVAFASLSDKEVRICKVFENGKRSEIQTALKIKNMLPKIVSFISESELLITSRLPLGRVAIYDVVAEKSTLYSSLGGKQLVGTKYVSNQSESLFSVAYEGGNVVNIDRRSKQWASELRLNNDCVGLDWSSTGLFLADARSNIYEFDFRNMTNCVSRTLLETTSSLTSFAMNGDSLLACGSPFGTVDILDAVSKKVLTSFDNLVTPVDSVRFHPVHRSLLIASSKEKRNAVRFYECATGKTMPAWPAATEVIGRALNSDFSQCGRFLTVGCKSGRVQLFAL